MLLICFYIKLINHLLYMNKEYTKKYYLENKEKLKLNNSNYKLQNKEKIKETNKIYREKYNKLNVICPICKRLMLKSSFNRHNKRKHAII